MVEAFLLLAWVLLFLITPVGVFSILYHRTRLGHFGPPLWMIIYVYLIMFCQVDI